MRRLTQVLGLVTARIVYIMWSLCSALTSLIFLAAFQESCHPIKKPLTYIHLRSMDHIIVLHLYTNKSD